MSTQEEVNDLVNKITKNNILYRTGNSKVPDSMFDDWVDRLTSLDTGNPILKNIGYISSSSKRKVKLKIPMGSMNKLKTIPEILKWVKSKKLNPNVEFILLPKYDGLAFTVCEDSGSGSTRGDGIYGERSDEHIKLIPHTLNKDNSHTFGEVIIKESVFQEKYSKISENSRNFVGGLLNNDKAPIELKDCDYIRFGYTHLDKDHSFMSKSDMIDYLNKGQRVQVPYNKVNISDITHDYIVELFEEWGSDYIIDGIIIEVNDYNTVKHLGRERNGNPAYARAIKLDIEKRLSTKVLELEYNISKNGDCIPRVRIEPIRLDGVTISWTTCYNAEFVKDNGVGVGATLEIKRSGGVIPKITKVIESVPFEIPNLGHDLEWDETGVHLRTVNITDEQRLKQLIAFFEIMDVDSVKEGTVTQFFNRGYDTVKKVLQMTIHDLLQLDGFGETSANKVFNSIRTKMRNVNLSKFQHASNCFVNLGSKKLLLLEDLDNPTLEELVKIDGYSHISACSYLDGISKFKVFREDLGGLVTVGKIIEKEQIGTDLSELVVVFTGVRRKDLEAVVVSRGGRMASGVSSKVTHLVTKTKGSGSSKEVKALELGKEIMTEVEFEQFLNK